MSKLTGSTKRSDWECRWGHELPRNWSGGRIQVEGDGRLTIPKLLCALLVSALLWVGIVALWSLT